MTRDVPVTPDHGHLQGLGLEQATEYLFVLLRYRWLIASVVVGMLAVTCVGSLLQTPVFDASVLLRVDRGKLNLVQDLTEEDRSLGVREFYGTERRVLTSRTLAARTLDRLDSWNHALLHVEDPEKGDVREQQIGIFLEMLEVSQVRDTQLLDVTVVSADPAFSRDLANAHAREYIAYVSEAQSGMARNTGSFIREQLEKLQRDIHDKETLLRQYGEQQDVVLEQSEAIEAQQLSELHRELTIAQGGVATAEARYRSLRESDPSSSPEVFNNPAILRLRQDLSGLEKEYAELEEKFEPKWPEMKRKRRAIEEVQNRLAAETRNLADKLVASARADQRAALNRVEILKRTLEQQRQDTRDLSARTSNYEKIRVELEGQREMLQQLTRRENETGLSADLEERQNVNVEIVEKAILPVRPFRPKLLMNLLIGGGLGLVLAPLLALFVNFWDTAVHGMDDLRRYVAVPCLAAIPHFAREKRLPSPGTRGRLSAGGQSRNRSKDLVRADRGVAQSKGYPDPSELAERFKFLRNGLLFSSPGNPPKVVLVTSGSAQEGKSFVASNFASSFAQLDKKVLLIDADLRLPSMHDCFGIRNDTGLTNLIIGQKTLQDGCVHKTNVPNLFVLPAGPQSPSPAELLSSKAMEEVLQQCAEHFDMVVMDSAPLFPVVDSHALAARADSALLVVRSGATKGPAVKKALELLERARGKVAGIVLNDIDVTDFAHSYYYRHYSYCDAPDSHQVPRGD